MECLGGILQGKGLAPCEGGGEALGLFEGGVQCPHHPINYSGTLFALECLPQIQRSWETKLKAIVLLRSPPALGLPQTSDPPFASVQLH